MQNVGYVQFTTNADRLPSSEWASPPATYNCICLSRNAAKVNSQGCKPLEIALSMRHSRNAATVQFREVPYHPRSGLIVIPHDVHPLGFWNNSEIVGTQSWLEIFATSSPTQSARDRRMVILFKAMGTLVGMLGVFVSIFLLMTRATMLSCFARLAF